MSPAVAFFYLALFPTKVGKKGEGSWDGRNVGFEGPLLRRAAETANNGINAPLTA